MSKGKNQKILKLKDINWNNFKIYKTNKNHSIIYRCKFCYHSRIKKYCNKIYKISGHSPNCKTIKRENFNRQNTTNQLNNIVINIQENTIENFMNKFDIRNNNDSYSTINEFNKNSDGDKLKLFNLLLNAFDKNKNLNKDQEIVGIYYMNKKKIIGEGSFARAFLGEDKFHRLNVIILKIDLNNEDSYINESFILPRIQGKGNFPTLYNAYSDDDSYYMVENFMGPDLKVLHKLCEKRFNYYTIINISIDLIKNIKILHSLGFIHRDLKPDNLVFGNMSYENSEKKKKLE